MADSVEPHLAAVLKDLKNRGHSRPAKLSTLKSTIKAQLKVSDKIVVALVEKLSAKGKVTIEGTKVSYKL